MQGLTVCVDYGDYLAFTLQVNAKHFDQILVVTSPQDAETQSIVAQFPNAKCLATDAFYRKGAYFNKGAAVEEGFDFLGRSDWTIVFDADVLFPSVLPFSVDDLDPQCLYSPWRRIMSDPSWWHPSLNWEAFPRHRDKVLAGYFQLFNGDCEALKGVWPWYGIHWNHAADCDSYFARHWHRRLRRRMDWDVLHLGPPETNWLGRVSARLHGERPPADNQELFQGMQDMLRRRRLYRLGDPRRWEGEIIR